MMLSAVGSTNASMLADALDLGIGHGAVIATRNVGDFADTGVVIVDPWSA